MDEYQLEINELRRTLERLREEEADPNLIDEYEVELRLLTSLHRAAKEMFEQGNQDPRLPQALRELELGDWTFANVYSFVYDAATANETGGRELAAQIDETDYAKTLLIAVDLVP